MIFSIGSELSMWIDPNGVICIKAVAPYDDPVELNLDEARILASKINEFIAQIEKIEGS